MLYQSLPISSNSQPPAATILHCFQKLNFFPRNSYTSDTICLSLYGSHNALKVYYLKWQDFLSWLNIPSCVCVCVCARARACMRAHHIFFIHFSMDGHLDCFHILATMNNTTLNSMNVQISLWYHAFIFFEYTSRSAIARPYGSSILNFLRNIHIVFPRDCTSLHSHQQCRRDPFSPHCHQHLLSLVFLIIDVPTGVR